MTPIPHHLHDDEQPSMRQQQAAAHPPGIVTARGVESGKAWRPHERRRTRSTVYGFGGGMISCTQPLASRCAQIVLDKGGNAADAAVAIAAALTLLEPSFSGIGGDAFVLYYENTSGSVKALNGSGRSPKTATLERVKHDLKESGYENLDCIPADSAHSVTVPGAAAAWCDAVKEFGSGKLSMLDILQPAIDLAEKGFVVAERSSEAWGPHLDRVMKNCPNYAECFKEDPPASGKYRAPAAGELFHNPYAASVFKRLGQEGKAGFYEGPVAHAIAKAVQDRGGCLTTDDLADHVKLGADLMPPYSVEFTSANSDLQSQNENGIAEIRLWEHGPNSQGIVALQALGIYRHLEKTGRIPIFKPKDHNTTPYLHAVIECLRIAFADAHHWIADPKAVRIPIDELLSDAYLAERASLFDPNKANRHLYRNGVPSAGKGDTSYWCVTDKHGNSCSFIMSVASSFGSGIVPKGCGFALQSRGGGFQLDPTSLNVFAGGKRPYQTIIPAMVTRDRCDKSQKQSSNTRGQVPQDLVAAMGIMAGFAQPQNHLQLLLNLHRFGMDEQTAIDAPRICVGRDTFPESGEHKSVFSYDSAETSAKVTDHGREYICKVHVEEGIPSQVGDELIAMGHSIEFIGGSDTGMFGTGGVITAKEASTRHGKTSWLWAGGADSRADGGVIPV